MITVFIVDDHAVVRHGLHAILAAEETFEVVGEASTGLEAVDAICGVEPDVVVSDIEMGELDGIELTKRLADLGCRARVLILTQYEEPVFVRAALRAGAAGYLLKQAMGAELVSAVAAVARGKTYVSLAPDHPALADAHSAGVSSGLSTREHEVLELLALGYSNQEIGARLHISDKTVGTYRGRLLDKLGLATRADLVHFALTEGILTPARAARDRRRSSKDDIDRDE